MRLKKIAFGCLVLSLLACSTVTNMILPPTANRANRRRENCRQYK